MTVEGYCSWCQLKPATSHYIRKHEVFNAETGQDLERSTQNLYFCTNDCRDAYFYGP